MYTSVSLVCAKLGRVHRRGGSGEADSDASSEASDGAPSEVDTEPGGGEPRQARPSGGDGSAPFDVMLTCYTLFERNSEDQRLDRSFLKSWDWSHVILDEAHAVCHLILQPAPPARVHVCCLWALIAVALLLLGILPSVSSHQHFALCPCQAAWSMPSFTLAQQARC